jgi:uroporphyrinogen-III synthase
MEGMRDHMDIAWWPAVAAFLVCLLMMRLLVARAPGLGLLDLPEGRKDHAAPTPVVGGLAMLAGCVVALPLALPPRTLQRLRRSATPWVLALSSGDALTLLLAQLPHDLQPRVREAIVVAASTRLAEQAAEAGFAQVHLAQGPLPRQLVQAAHAAIITSAPS